MFKRVETIGIDLGTTTSCVAAYINGELGIIENRDGERITPSVVCFDANGSQPIVGSNAILSASTSPENFVFEVKRMFGKGYHSKEVQRAMKFWPFKLKEIKTTGKKADENDCDNIGIVVNENGSEKVYEPIQVSAYVLNYLLESAKQRLGIYPTHVTITVPAYFSQNAKDRTLDAARIAFSNKRDENNNVLDFKIDLLAEPTAAALAYASILMKNKQVKNDEEARMLVFDLGGGTYDVSVVDFIYNYETPFGRVAATDGDNFLGGSDFDNVIIQLAKNKYEELKSKGMACETNMSDMEKLKSDLRLRQEAIKVKTSLSTNLKATFNLPCYRGVDLVFELTRVQFERAAKHLFDRLLEKIKGVLLSIEGFVPVYSDDGILNVATTLQSAPSKGLEYHLEQAKKTINKVIMVGGSSRIPKVKTVLEDFFGESSSTSPDVKRVISPLNPDEAVAYGAGYQANSSCKDKADNTAKILLIDTVPLNLSIETLGGVATPIIKAQTNIPCKETQMFSTAVDNQTSVDIVITQGNRYLANDNQLIGKFTLSGIAPAKRGVPQIEVTLEVDHNSTLKVTAVNKATGSSEQIVVENMSMNLSKSDIENMIKQAAEHAELDKKAEQKIVKRNEYQTILYAALDKAESSNLPNKSDLINKINTRIAWVDRITPLTTLEEIEQQMNEFNAECAELMGGQSSSGNQSNVEEVQ